MTARISVGSSERGFAAADHVIEQEFHIDRVTGVPLEPRSALADYDASTGRITWDMRFSDRTRTMVASPCECCARSLSRWY